MGGNESLSDDKKVCWNYRRYQGKIWRVFFCCVSVDWAEYIQSGRSGHTQGHSIIGK